MADHPTARVIHADCLTALRDMPDASVDAVVTDPPYGLSNTTPDQVAEAVTRWVSGEREYLPSARGFMGHEWDGFVPPVAVWDECLRVLKPGGHLLAFAGSRTQDLMGLAVRLAGFEIRDSVAWLYGSGFPKSMDVSKAIDKAAGAEREVIGPVRGRLIGGAGGVSTNHGRGGAPYGLDAPTAPATDAAREWEGWGTALKPAHEPVILARKPMAGTVASNVLEHGTGALNINACRVSPGEAVPGGGGNLPSGGIMGRSTTGKPSRPPHTAGRWPANVVLDESQATELDRQSGILANAGNKPGSMRAGRADGAAHERTSQVPTYSGGPSIVYDDKGGASRFFYVAKAPKRERPVVDGTAHPTVKPVTLMRWLVRMVTPPGGTVLDPFAGSGTTLEAATLEGVHAVGIEREADYLPLIHHRLTRANETRERADETATGYLFDLDTPPEGTHHD